MAIRAMHTANRRARKTGIAGVITTEDVLNMWERQPVCVGCGIGRGLDHVIAMSLGGPNTPANLQNLCHACNIRKGNLERVPV